MKKYNISKDFGLFANFSPPFNRCVFPVASLMLGVTPKILKDNKYVKIIQKKITTNDKKDINLYIFDPVNLKTDKVILYIHGGGFAFRGHYSHYDLCFTFAKQCSCKVVYVDYRLSPKYKYPIPLNDCFMAYKWIIENADTLKIDINKIIVAGDSAGGCLAVDVTLKAIQENIVKPYYQMLIYPALDKRMITQSMNKYTNTPMWNSKLNKKMWKYYLGDGEYISPGERLDLDGLPPTYIEVAEFDCLHDEGVEFAHKLQNDKIPVLLYETKKTMHGYDIKKCLITEAAIKKRIEVLNKII